MKKIIIFFFVIISIVCVMYYIYLNNIAEYKKGQQENLKYEVYKDKEIEGIQIATIINKAIDENKKNNITKDKTGTYIDNNKNSINIDLKFIDSDVTLNIEKIYMSGIDKFIAYYGDIKFKCTDIQYHKETNRVKYMLFEQIT